MTEPLRSAGGDPAAWAARPASVEPERAAQAFEALLLAQILERAQEPALGGGHRLGGFAGSLYRSWFAREVAEQMAARGGFGLARALVEQEARRASGEEPR